MSIQDKPQTSFGDKALSTAYKVGGWNLRLKAIGSLITGIAFIILGIVLSIVLKTFNTLIFSGIGLIALLASWFYWKRARSLVKGRFY